MTRGNVRTVPSPVICDDKTKSCVRNRDSCMVTVGNSETVRVTLCACAKRRGNALVDVVIRSRMIFLKLKTISFPKKWRV